MGAGRALLGLDSPFSYSCRRCTRCCVGKRVQVNPYEIARIARAKGMPTGEARRRYVGADSALKKRDGERCVFLSGDACEVHADRPLVCRMFPHSRVVEADGTEWFREGARAGVGGVFGQGGTVADYLETQGAGPFRAAADAYFAWFLRARDHVADAAGDGGNADWLDMDAEIARWCAARDEPEPADMGRAARAAPHDPRFPAGRRRPWLTDARRHSARRFPR